MSEAANWYVVHTYSGYENKVKTNLEKTVENRDLQDMIVEVRIPVEDAVEIKNGKRKTVQRKVFPGYVLVKMVMNEETWYIVRNTRGVTGFVGPESKPVPLTEEEVEKMGMDHLSTDLDYEVGDNVRIVSGPLESFVGVVEAIDMEHQRVRVAVSMFGRDTATEMDFAQVERI